MNSPSLKDLDRKILNQNEVSISLYDTELYASDTVAPKCYV